MHSEINNKVLVTKLLALTIFISFFYFTFLAALDYYFVAVMNEVKGWYNDAFALIITLPFLLAYLYAKHSPPSKKMALGALGFFIGVAIGNILVILVGVIFHSKLGGLL